MATVHQATLVRIGAKIEDFQFGHKLTPAALQITYTTLAK
jgi:hypothetical protein